MNNFEGFSRNLSNKLLENRDINKKLFIENIAWFYDNVLNIDSKSVDYIFAKSHIEAILIVEILQNTDQFFNSFQELNVNSVLKRLSEISVYEIKTLDNQIIQNLIENINIILSNINIDKYKRYNLIKRFDVNNYSLDFVIKKFVFLNDFKKKISVEFGKYPEDFYYLSSFFFDIFKNKEFVKYLVLDYINLTNSDRFIQNEYEIKFNLKNSNFDNEYYDHYRNLVLSNVNGFMPYNDLCVAIEKPEIILNNLDELHSIDNMAIQYKDGFGFYFIDGNLFDNVLYQKIIDRKFTVEEFFKIENEEIKSNCIQLIQERFGDEYLFDFFSKQLKEIDTYVDKKDKKYLEGTTGGMNIGVYTLFSGQIENVEISYVRCYCPSTDRMFFLGVENEHKNAKDAIASLYRVPVKLRKHIKYIQRQGERFSTVFTKEGVKILKTLTKEDVRNTTTITGDEYFSLMRYEY